MSPKITLSKFVEGVSPFECHDGLSVFPDDAVGAVFPVSPAHLAVAAGALSPEDHRAGF